ncbi:Secreted beta-glucosidase sun1 [Blastocladiella emersonii ATCC 22665]|nr:Secreted beta-glucosidase sun1 [Blastocladiella emersonii ATCC 22665]
MEEELSTPMRTLAESRALKFVSPHWTNVGPRKQDLQLQRDVFATGLALADGKRSSFGASTSSNAPPAAGERLPLRPIGVQGNRTASAAAAGAAAPSALEGARTSGSSKFASSTAASLTALAAQRNRATNFPPPVSGIDLHARPPPPSSSSAAALSASHPPPKSAPAAHGFSWGPRDDYDPPAAPSAAAAPRHERQPSFPPDTAADRMDRSVNTDEQMLLRSGKKYGYRSSSATSVFSATAGSSAGAYNQPTPRPVPTAAPHPYRHPPPPAPPRPTLGAVLAPVAAQVYDAARAAVLGVRFAVTVVYLAVLLILDTAVTRPTAFLRAQLGVALARSVWAALAFFLLAMWMYDPSLVDQPPKPAAAWSPDQLARLDVAAENVHAFARELDLLAADLVERGARAKVSLALDTQPRLRVPVIPTPVFVGDEGGKRDPVQDAQDQIERLLASMLGESAAQLEQSIQAAEAAVVPPAVARIESEVKQSIAFVQTAVEELDAAVLPLAAENAQAPEPEPAIPATDDVPPPPPIPLANYAATTYGARPVASATSPTYRFPVTPRWYLPAFLGVTARAHPPATALATSADATLDPLVPGRCWATPANAGDARLTVHLARPARPVAIAIAHLTRDNAPRGDVSSAPRAFRVLGRVHHPHGQRGGGYAAEDWRVLVRGEYVAGDVERQEWPVDMRRVVADESAKLDQVRLVVEENHGNTAFTCVYRVEVLAPADARGDGEEGEGVE